MKSISTPSLLFLLVALATIPSSIYAISFTVDTSGCDGDPFDNLDLIVSCNNSSSCSFGNTAIISGTVEATSAFSNNAVTLQACVMNTYCPKDYARNAGNLCNWLTPTEDQECGAVGMYSIASEQEIPEAVMLTGYSWLVTVNIGVEEECEAGGTSQQMAYSMAGLVSLVMGAAALAARKKRRACTNNDDERATRFVEMRDVV
eukprot:CAMPEP_0202018700 /NCGR_PEP_ID=MMETSP0905-20130828/40149_1 /ASSEMBLY_ACC=CAM_ASM_000554 /TAXON_ID=420261 /ORGANISM="Thalassiosira antarctica, Strain CCMP982" /LENGTH=202 /DNA_ID=CAMNT_0048579729 /DNA_START=211 /DNA_END=819 /DNA_ORIENTATION=-